MNISPWNNLSIADKAAMMEVAIKNGITTLPEIREAYNEFAKGGNLYPDGGYVRSTNNHPVAFDSEGNLVDQVTGETGTMMFPEILLTADPDDVARGRAQRWYKDFGIESNDATSVADGRRQNSHLDERGAEGAARAADWAKAHPVLNTLGLAAAAVPFTVAAYPAAVVTGEAVGTALTNPYVDAGLTSAFGAHGLNHAINEGITDWKDGVMTALEVTPLGRLVKPLWNASKEGLQYAVKAADNVARDISPSYDLYRTVSETTPSVRVRDPYVDVKGLEGADKSYIKIESPLENLTDAKRGIESEAYYLFAPKDIDILKLRNASFGSGKFYDGPVLGSGSIDGKFVSYGEPWMEFAPGEKTALYEMPTGPRRGPSLMATDFRGNRMDYSVDEAYNAVLRDRQFHQDIKDMELKDILQFKRDNYPDLIKGIPTDIYHANQTVIPNKNWNFDKFLKTPLWKYSEDPASGQVQKELMMRWPEVKPLETPTVEWVDAARTPQITAENAASITSEQWTAAQDAAIARGDMTEAQRLRDLHFKVSAPNTKTDVPLWSSSEETFNSFDLSHFGETDSGFFGYGHYLTPIEKYAATYHPVNRKFYANIENPYIGSNDQYFNRIQYVKDRLARRKENVIHNLRDGKLTKFSKKLGINENTSLEDAERLVDKYIADETVKWNDKYVKYADEFEGKDGVLSWRELQGIPNKQEGIYREVVVPRGEQIKSADAVTYDDNGVRIPLGLRDNFKLNDIRYGLLPFLGLGAASALYGTSDNKHSLGGNLFGRGGAKKQAFLSSLDQSLKEDNRFDNAQWRQFFTDLANMESGYSSNITNSIGAKGYFQLMPFNRAKTWNNPTQQFHEMYKLTGNNLNYLNKNLTKEDWKKADALGIDMYGMLAGAHLGGAGNVLKALRGKGNAKDMNGSSVMGYMTKFSQRGKTPTLATPSYVEEPMPLFTPSNPEVFFGGYKAPEIEAPLPSVELDDTPQYSEEEIARQERRERLNNLSMLMNLTSPQGSSNSMLDALGLLMR